MFPFKNKSKPHAADDFERELDSLVAEARRSGVSSGEMMAAMSGHIVSMERQALMARERRQFRTDGLHVSGNLPE